jgi:hypothetical protein
MVLNWSAQGPWAGRQTEEEVIQQLTSSLGVVTELSLAT